MTLSAGCCRYCTDQMDWIPAWMQWFPSLFLESCSDSGANERNYSMQWENWYSTHPEVWNICSGWQKLKRHHFNEWAAERVSKEPLLWQICNSLQMTLAGLLYKLNLSVPHLSLNAPLLDAMHIRVQFNCQKHFYCIYVFIQPSKPPFLLLWCSQIV